MRCLRAICKSENSPRGTWRSRPEHDLCTLDRGMFPIADRPGRRTISPCLHNQCRCQKSPCAGAQPAQIAVSAPRLPARSSFLGLSVARADTKKLGCDRCSAAERRTDRAWQASPVPPAADVCIAGSALPSVVAAVLYRRPTRMSRRNTSNSF